MVKVYEYQNPSWGIVFKKISKALRNYSPEWIEWVDNIEISDVQFVHVVGAGEVEIIRGCSNPVIFQQCYLTSGYNAWDLLWEKSLLTVSFYNLLNYTNKKFNFLHLPIGYEPNIYKAEVPFEKRSRLAFVTGHIAETEHIYEIYYACKKAGYTLLHTGKNFKLGSNYLFFDYMSEPLFSSLLNDVKYVFGLRVIEGFEVAVLEGIACGAEGVVPLFPSYDWYNNLAIRIDTESSNLVENIYNILKNEIKINKNEEKLKEFRWENILNKFYNILWQLLNE